MLPAGPSGADDVVRGDGAAGGAVDGAAAMDPLGDRYIDRSKDIIEWPSCSQVRRAPGALVCILRLDSRHRC